MENTMYNIWRWICNQNYKYELYAFKKKVDGSLFYMYDPPVPKRIFYDKLLQIILSNVRNGDHVYDVGAARGLYTLSFAKSGCSVYSFEPNLHTYSSLLKNVRLNHLNNVSCFNIGLSDTADTLTFYLTDPALESSFNKELLISENTKIIGTEKVTVNTIDKLVNEGVIIPPEHIKIDVEGFELNVLLGGRETISEHRPMIYFEPHFGKDEPCHRKRLHDYFKKIDYTVEEHERDRSPQWVCTPINRD